MRGRVVRSKAGRDKDTFGVVVASADGYWFVCDGKQHPLAAPKRKNPKHLAETKTVFGEEQLLSDHALRRALAIFRDGEAPKEER